MRIIVAVLLMSVVGLAGCDSTEATGPEVAFTFDEGLGGWTAHGIDLVVGGEEVAWAVEHTTATGAAAPGAVRFYLENDTDAGKIWMQRPFALTPNTRYVVRVRYAFGTTDWGDVNLWTLITGVHPDPPETHEDLTYQGHTGHGAESDVGPVWLEKAYELTAETDDDGRLYVAVGVWGTWETARTYFVDDLRLTFVPR